MFTRSHRRTPSGVRRLDVTLNLNVEQLTNEERLSRSLHHIRRPSNAEKPRLFEWFLVIGVEPASNGATPTTAPPNLLKPTPQQPNNSTPVRPSSPFSFSKPPLVHSKTVQPNLERRDSPKVLYQYPPDKSLGSINVQDFPFPSGVSITQQSQTASHTNLFQLLYTQNHLKELDNSFVFMLTDERKDVLYGICTMKLSPVEHLVGGYIDIDEEPNDSDIIETGDTINTAQKCYVILSKYPFFPLHFNILNGVLAIMHMQQISRFQNLISAKRRQRSNSLPSNTTTTPTTNLISNTTTTTTTISTKESSLTTSSTDYSIVVPQITTSFKEPIKELIEYFYNQSIPMPGQTISYNVPNLDTTISFRRTSQKPNTDPTNDYNDFTLEYGLFPTLQLLTHKTIIIILSAILIERKLVFYSKSLRCLTSVIFSITSLLKPFIYQSVLLPIIPNALKDVISAPVPFIVGVNSYVEGEIDLNDVILVDIDQNKVQTNMPHVALLPNWRDLANRMIDTQKHLKNSLESKKVITFVANNDIQEALCDQFSLSVHKHLESLFANFKRHCIRDVSQLKHVSVFVPETFVIEYDDDIEGLEFITQFMKTQIFFNFQDRQLRLSDGEDDNLK